MKIETEFNKGDKVVFTTPILEGIRDGSVLHVYTYNNKIEYDFENISGVRVPEQFIASTREDLKAKLFDNINKLFEG